MFCVYKIVYYFFDTIGGEDFISLRDKTNLQFINIGNSYLTSLF